MDENTDKANKGDVPLHSNADDRDFEKVTLYHEAIKDTERASLALFHPLLTGSVLLPTLPIEGLFRAIKRAVVLRETGICFSARSGVGKTSALEMVEAMLRIQLPRMPIYVHDTHNQQLPSVRAFFKHFLYTVGHSEKRGETYDLRERLVNCMIDDARISGSNIVLLFIDEAHAMAVQDFDFLKDVYNDLNRESVQLITVLMGQEPDLSNVIFKLKTLGRLDLIGRFAMRIQPFRAFDSIRDLTQILKGIDQAVFPESSNITWTAFFFPEAYKSGFRLENEAPRFMEAISAASPKSSGQNFAFPARQTFLAIRTLMIDCAVFDKANMMLPDVAWIEAVEYAKLQDSMQLMKVGDEGNGLEVRT